MNTPSAEVVRPVYEKHPNADRLLIAHIRGFTCVTGSEPTELAVYIPPDSLVPVARPEFAFLAPKANKDGYARIKAIKLRGVPSFGLIVPAPAGTFVEGDDLSEAWGVKHYEPEVASNPRSGPSYRAPGHDTEDCPIFVPVYDIENGRHYNDVLTPGEPVYYTEKLHGENFRCVYAEGRMWVGSRKHWKRESPDRSDVSVEQFVARGMEQEKAERIVPLILARHEDPDRWWKAMHDTPGLEDWCRRHPGIVVFGETVGHVGGFDYGMGGVRRVFVFDLWVAGSFVDSTERTYGPNTTLPWVPVLAEGPFDFGRACELAEGQSTLAAHVREGCVVCPYQERDDNRCGRVKLKFVGAGYLERN